MAAAVPEPEGSTGATASHDRDDWALRKRRIGLPDDRSIAFVEVEGAGPAFLLLHGYSDTSRSFEALAAHLKGYHLLIPDLPGHGGSDAGPAAGLEEVADDIGALIGTLGIRPGLVLGHSLGSMLALSMAARGAVPGAAIVTLAGTACPALEGLGLLAEIARFPDRLAPDHPFFEAWYEGPLPVEPAFVAAVRREAAAMPVAVWRDYLGLVARADLRPLLPRVTAPVLTIAGDRDALFGEGHRRLLDALPNRRDVVMPGHGHNPHWEDAEAVAALVLDWRKSL